MSQRVFLCAGSWLGCAACVAVWACSVRSGLTWSLGDGQWYVRAGEIASAGGSLRVPLLPIAAMLAAVGMMPLPALLQRRQYGPTPVCRFCGSLDGDDCRCQLERRLRASTEVGEESPWTWEQSR